jgi:tetratricopeptide (TPR) repeat protein
LLPTRPAALLLPVVGTDTESLGYPTQTIDRLAVRRLLLKKSFDELDAVLSAYGDSAVRDYRIEYRLFDAYAAFEVAIPSLEPLLNEWVDRNPGSASALLARGTFYHAMGSDARGADSASKTTREQFRQMSSYYKKATADMNAALRIAPSSMVAYEALMWMTTSEGDREAAAELTEKALKIQPYSFVLRGVRMATLTPRWGGSYEKMQRFARESAPYATRNPRIGALAGYIEWDRGRFAEEHGKNAEAIQAYGRALEYGDLWLFRYARAERFDRDDRNADALEDLNKAVMQRPQDPDALYRRSRVGYAVGFQAKGEARDKYFAQAYDDIVLSVALDPSDTWHQRQLAFVRKNIPGYAPPPLQ